jgi:hypothetical protein
VATNRVPRSTPLAPRASAATSPRPVGDPAGRDDRHADRVDHLRQEGHHAHGRRVGRRGLAVNRAMAAGFASLRHDHVGAAGRRGARVLDRRDHRHHLDPAATALLG